MINLYVSPRIFQKHIGDGSDLDLLFCNSSVRLFLDVDDIDKYINEDDSNPDLFKDLDASTVKAGKSFIDLIRNGESIEIGLARCILLLDDIEDEKAMSIRAQYGIMCYTYDSRQDLLNNLTCKSKYTTKVVYNEKNWPENREKKSKEKANALTAPADSNKRGWDFYFAPFVNIPVNSIIFIDRHIKNDYIIYNNAIFDNVFQIIDKCISCDCKQAFHILFIAGADKKDSEKERKDFLTIYIDAINKRIASLSSKCSFLVEYIFCDNKLGKKDLYEHIHDRHVYSNYISIDAPKSIAAFLHNKNVVVNSLENQKLSVLSCFPDGFGNSIYVESEEGCKSSYIKNIVSDLEEGIKTQCDGNSRYSYEIYHINATEGIVPLGIKDKENIRNRMIMDEIELKDGDGCWYLSVPYSNDWANIKVSDFHVFHENEREAFKRCVWRKEGRTDKKELIKIADEISNLFKNAGYKQVKNDNEKYYRVVVPYPSDLKRYDEKSESWKSAIHVIGSKQCEKAFNQYEFNRFANEVDAMDIANKVSEKLGMGHVYSEPEINGIKDIKDRGYFFKP